MLNNNVICCELVAVGNLLTGTIPSQFQKLKKLQVLNLGKKLQQEVWFVVCFTRCINTLIFVFVLLTSQFSEQVITSCAALYPILYFLLITKQPSQMAVYPKVH